jgi:poly(3-hydroxybutyrate) depolymerase
MTTPNLAATPLLAALLLLPPVAAAQQGPAVPDGVRHRAVDIWSEGTRMAGDLYRPADIGDDPAPAIIMSHGWGGTARAEYHVIPDITHYDIAREWFNGCLKD